MIRGSGQRWGAITYAQHGDDLMLLNLCELLGIEKPSYLDLGAHHPITISNTALLYERGARGVNVEANPRLIAEFKRQRPEDIVVNVGVAPERGELPFFMYGETSGINSFSKDHVEFHKHLKVEKEEALPVVTVNDIVDVHCGGRWPDILLLDIEGMDFAVLQSADFSKSRPRVIVVEVRRGESADMKALLAERGFVCYCRMSANLFFVQETESYLVY